MNEKYTKQEKQLIKRAFELTRFEFDKDPDPNDDGDIIIAVKKYKNFHHMGADNQKIATEIFRKNGLWRNGKTTLEEYNKQLIEKKLEKTIKLRKAQEKHVIELKELRGTIDEKIKELEEKPREITARLLEKRKQLQASAYDQLDATGKRLQEHLRETATRLDEEYVQEREKIIDNLKQEIENLKQVERDEIDAVFDEYDELIKLKRDYDDLQDDYDRKEKPIVKEIEKIDESLFDLTVRELKEMADQKGLEYPARIIKKDLVDLIENNENDEIIFE